MFDACYVKGQGEAIDYNKHVSIIDTKEKETVDQYIEKTARAIPKKYKVGVATLDATEQVIVLGTGVIEYRIIQLKIGWAKGP